MNLCCRYKILVAKGLKYVKKKKTTYVHNIQLEIDTGVIAYIDNYQDYNKTGNRFSLDKFVDKMFNNT